MRNSDLSSDVCSSDLLWVAGWGAGRCRSENRSFAISRTTPQRTAMPLASRSAIVSATSTALRSSAHTPKRNPRNTFIRSEEHTSELQSLMRTSYAVFCLKTKRHLNHLLVIHNFHTSDLY